MRAGQSEVVASFPDLRQTKADSDRNAGVAMVSVGRSLRELGSRRHLFSVGVWLAEIPTAAISAPNRGEATHCRPGLGPTESPYGRDLVCPFNVRLPPYAWR